MTEVSRRSFLGGALALVAATQLPASAFAAVPTIYGDGFHDDTAGLNAALAGKPFRVVGEGVYVVRRDGQIILSSGVFKITSTINITRPNTTITGCSFEGHNMADGADALHVHPGADGCMVVNCHIQNAGGYGIRHSAFLSG